ncbi:MAG: hypothetical protein HY878_04475 [Deltaproteobacteria bacterium]|nr:hypothetical protein [Deltaproteobacteria bacterium]
MSRMRRCGGKYLSYDNRGKDREPSILPWRLSDEGQLFHQSDLGGEFSGTTRKKADRGFTCRVEEV